MNYQLGGHLSIAFDKIASGLLTNALKYLVPTWMSPFSGAAIRVVFGAVAFTLIDLFRPHSVRTPLRTKAEVFFLGMICIFGYMALFMVGIRYTTPTSCAIIFTLIPIWVLLLSVWVTQTETFSWLKGVGIVVGLCGALLSILSHRDSDLASHAVLGDLILMVGSFCYAVYLTIGARLSRRVDAITMTKWSFIGASVPALIIVAIWGFRAPVLQGDWLAASHLTATLVLLFSLFIATLVSYLLLPIAMRRLQPSMVSIYQYLSVIVTTITSVILGQDRLSWQQIAAIVVICIGVGLVQKDNR